MDNIQITKECSHAGYYDVIVCGGGPAGVCAAIASARQGAKTLLIERNGELGGFWTSGLLSWIADVTDKTGVVKELRRRQQFDKPSILKREQKQRAVYVQQLQRNED